MVDLPANPDAEMAVLGSMMLSKDAVGEVVLFLDSDDFFRPAHATVYQVVVDMFSEGKPTDAMAVRAELERRKEIKTGYLDAPYLHSLVSRAVATSSVAHHANLVRDAAVARRLRAAGEHIMQISSSGGDVRDLVDRAQGVVLQSAARYAAEGTRVIGDLLPSTVEAIEASRNTGELVGIGSGLADLDRITNGFRPGQLVVVAGRPAMGKSTLALDICRYAAMGKVPVAFFSLEMEAEELSRKTLAAQGKIDLSKLQSGHLSPTDWEELSRTVATVGEFPLYVDDSPHLTPSLLQAKVRRLVAMHGVRLVVVDYLQLMGSSRRHESRQQEVSEISRSLKLMAKELSLPVLAISQLNRGPETRTDKRPQLSDLRESGAIEQDADIVLFVHRPEVYDSDERVGEADVILAKHRNGPTGVVTAAFQGRYSRFVDLY